MKPPIYQKIFAWILYALIGFLALGDFLNAITNAISIVVPAFTYIGSISVVCSWIFLEVFLKRRPIHWSLGADKYIMLRGLSAKPRLALIGIICLLWVPRLVSVPLRHTSEVTPAAITTALLPPTKQPGHVILAIADFTGPETASYGVSQIIIEQLESATKEFQDLEIRHLPLSLDTNGAARQHGQEIGANIIIWGSYQTTRKQVRVNINFTVLKKPRFLTLNKEHHTFNLPVAELENFSIQENLSSQMTYLTLFTVGLTRYENEQYEEAIHRFTNALKMLPPKQFLDPSYVYFFRGSSYLYEGNEDKALVDFDNAIKLRPNYPDAYVDRALCHINKHEIDYAIGDLNIAIALSQLPGNAEAFNSRGICYLIKGFDEKAFSDFNLAVAINPTLALGYANRATYYMRSGNGDAAVEDMTRAISLSDDPIRFYIGYGTAFLTKNDLLKAIDYMSKYVETYPDSAFGHFSLGGAYYQSGKLDRAITELNTAIGLDPEIPMAYSNRGQIHLDRGELEEALNDINKSIELDSLFSTEYGRRAEIYLGMGKYDLALADATKEINMSPDDPAGYSHRSDIYNRKGEHKRAIADLNVVIRLSPDKALAYYNRGVEYQATGEYDAGISDFTKAIDLSPA